MYSEIPKWAINSRDWPPKLLPLSKPIEISGFLSIDLDNPWIRHLLVIHSSNPLFISLFPLGGVDRSLMAQYHGTLVADTDGKY